MQAHGQTHRGERGRVQGADLIQRVLAWTEYRTRPPVLQIPPLTAGDAGWRRDVLCAHFSRSSAGDNVMCKQAVKLRGI